MQTRQFDSQIVLVGTKTACQFFDQDFVIGNQGAFDPPLGATNVDPARTTLAVTFDRAMDREGWAWVIEDKATAPDIGESTWDAAVRTNSAPVKLEPGKTYVVWINSPQYSYFKDPQGRAATPVRWSFTTRAAAATPAGS